MEKTIYNTYVPMESQEQADRMKQVCVDNGLPIWKEEIAFYYSSYKRIFTYAADAFWIIKVNYNDRTKVTEQQWLELLKTTKR